MTANKYEKFVVEKVHRTQIRQADYNPRNITPEAAKKLRSVKNVWTSGWIVMAYNEKPFCATFSIPNRTAANNRLANGPPKAKRFLFQIG